MELYGELTQQRRIAWVCALAIKNKNQPEETTSNVITKLCGMETGDLRTVRIELCANANRLRMYLHGFQPVWRDLGQMQTQTPQVKERAIKEKSPDEKGDRGTVKMEGYKYSCS